MQALLFRLTAIAFGTLSFFDNLFIFFVLLLLNGIAWHASGSSARTKRVSSVLAFATTALNNANNLPKLVVVN